MNSDKLFEGQVFKNYRVMCEELGLKVMAGDSKKYQLKDLKRFCALTQKGHSLIVTEVFSDPAPKIDGRGAKSVYGELLQLLFTDFFIGLEENRVTLTRNTLLTNMKMINDNYRYGSVNVPHVSKHTNIKPQVVHDFFNTTKGNYKYMVESTLDSLRKKSLIMYDKVTIVCKDDGTHEIASPSERELILVHEKKALQSLGYDEINQVIASRKWEEYKSRVQIGLQQQGIKYYYSSYDIIINEKYIGSDHDKMLKGVLEKIERDSKMDELNILICERLVENAHKRKANTKLESSMHLTRSVASYNDDNKKLVSLLVDVKNTERLRNK